MQGRTTHGVGWGLAAVAFGVLLGMGAGAAGAAELAGELVRASGPVEVRPLGEAAWRPAALRAVLHPGDMVRTGPGGAAEVALVHGVFRMDENTVIILPPPRPVPAAAGGPTAIQLLLFRGRALFQVLKERLQGSFDVITPSVIVGVKGTTFGVEQRTVIGVVVFDGSVEARPAGRPAATPLTVGAGQFTVLAQGRLAAPQPFQPGAPGALWSGAPTSPQSVPLAVPPAPAPAGPAAQVPPPAPVVPALALGAPAPAATAVARAVAAPAAGFAPPRLAAVGGPPGRSGAFAASAVSNVSDEAQASVQAGEGKNAKQKKGRRGGGGRRDRGGKRR